MSASPDWRETAAHLRALVSVLREDDVYVAYDGEFLEALAERIEEELAFDPGGSRTVAVDFDFCVHGYSRGWYTGDCYDDPVAGVREALEELSSSFRVVIFTARDSLPDVRAWLMKHDLMRYVSAVTGQKPSALAYIDDRAVCFDPASGSWPAALEATYALIERKRRHD